jgi:hypothetical protein
MTNRIQISKVVFILLFTGLLACRKDKPIPTVPNNNTECYEFEGLPVLTYFYKKGNQYQTPYFNPNNVNEFVYNFRNYELDESKLMKYNLQTGVKTELANNVKIISQPKWSRKGWVAFDNVYSANYQIWITKDNGDSLTQITNTPYNLYPVWDTTGYNLFWQNEVILASFPSFFLKKNIYEVQIDTLIGDGLFNHSITRMNDISIDNKLLTKTLIGNSSHLAYTNVNNIFFQSLVHLEQENLIGLIGLTWSDNSQIAYFTVYNNSDNDGLFRLNIPTGSYTKIMNFCDTKKYKSISCSPDGKKLIGERVDSYLARDSNGNPTGQIVENSSIYLIDLEIMEETKINLE